MSDRNAPNPFPTSPWLAQLRAAIERYGPPLPLAGVLGLYILAAFIVPTMADVSISDDWTYVRSVEILHETGELKVLPVAAAAVVFQTLWASLFTEIFGMSLGVVRLATVVLTFGSGLAMYGLCRELGVSQRRSALGAGAYLFNPLAFVLGYTFMSDPYFTALLTISSYLLVKGLRPDNSSSPYTVLASLAISAALLVRIHALLILLGPGIYLLVTRRISPDRRGLRLLTQLGLAPLLTLTWYYLIFARGLPSQQDLFWGEAKSAWFDEAWLLVQRLTFVELMYGGLFALPVVAGALAGIRWEFRFRWPGAWSIVAAWGAILIVGLRYFGDDDTRLLDSSRHVMPYIPHFLGRAGLGAGDLRYARPDITGDWFWNGLTAVCALSSIGMALFLARRVKPGSPRNGGPAGLLLILGILQAGGVIAPSLLFRNWVISLDRYLLPLLPFAIALTLWALKDTSLNEAVSWTVLALMAALSITGTRDALEFQDSVWSMAEFANELAIRDPEGFNRLVVNKPGCATQFGIKNSCLDAGYAWDSYHLWECGYAFKLPVQSPSPYGTWWTDTYAPATNSSYVVAGAPVEGYTAIYELEYSQWLQTDETTLYLLRRNDLVDVPTDLALLSNPC